MRIVPLMLHLLTLTIYRSSPPEVFLWKSVQKICSRFTGKCPCRNVISIKLLCNFIEITPRHGWSPVNLIHIFKTPFPKNTVLSCCLYVGNVALNGGSGQLLEYLVSWVCFSYSLKVIVNILLFQSPLMRFVKDRIWLKIKKIVLIYFNCLLCVVLQYALCKIGTTNFKIKWNVKVVSSEHRVSSIFYFGHICSK